MFNLNRLRFVSAWLGVLLVTFGLMVPTRAQDTPPDRSFTELPMGRLYLPNHLTPRDGRLDLIIHFHGGANVMPNAVDRLRINAAVLLLQRNGLSSVYRRPFEDPALFGQVLRDAEAAVRESTRFDDDIELGRVILVSFSAGYGAVREIVKSPAYVDRIDGILLTDSMYASYAGDPADHVVEPAHISPYVDFAERAIAGEKVFVITHTQLPPGGYAGTHECAAALLGMLGLEPQTVAAEEDVPALETEGLSIVTRTDAESLHVYGYAGETGEDHGRHLMNTALWLPLLPLEFLPDDD